LSIELALAEAVDAPSESSHIAAPRQAPPQPVPVSRTESQPTASSSSAVEPQKPAESPVINAGDITKAWKHLAASLPKSQANLSALLNSVRMIDVQGKSLILGLASDVLVSKIDKPDQIEIIQKLIKDNFNVELSIRCIVTNAKGKIPDNVAQDGMVAAAIQHGGEIVDAN